LALLRASKRTARMQDGWGWRRLEFAIMPVISKYHAPSLLSEHENFRRKEE
jgi:hypothetical protein